MNSRFYRLARYGRLIPLKSLIKMSGQRMILPFYHLVTDCAPAHIKNLYKPRSVASFEADLDFFLRHYTPLSAQEFAASIRNQQPITQNSFLLTFDDGLREFHEIIAPVLLRKGVPAICFLNSDFVDNKALFFRYKASILLEELKKVRSISEAVKRWFRKNELRLDSTFSSILTIDYTRKHLLDELALILNVNFEHFLATERPYLDSDQIKGLIAKGFTFGAHSIDHPLYSSLSIQEQIRQTEDCMNALQKQFVLDGEYFSFPFTDHGVTSSFFDQVLNPAKPIAEITFGCSGLKKEDIPLHFQRIPIEIGNYSAEEVVYGEYLYYLAKSLFRKNTIHRS